MTKYFNTKEVENGKEQVANKKFIKRNTFDETVSKFPKHIVELSAIVKNNSEIRRFTALGIINYLQQKGEIKGDKKFVSFKWNKFRVIVDGLSRDYYYTEPFFLNAFVAAFSSFSASAQRTIDNFCKKELNSSLSDNVTNEEVNNITEMTEKYVESHPDAVDNNEE